MELPSNISAQPIPLGIKAPIIYANTFDIGLSGNDLSVVLKVNNEPVNELKVSMNAAKSIADGINAAISLFEAATGDKVKSTDEVNKLLQAAVASRTSAK